MGESRPSMQSVQSRLILVVLVALILGCAGGLSLFRLYIWQAPGRWVYEGGSYPGELAPAYQAHYKAMVVDSYLFREGLDVDTTRGRLQAFDKPIQIQLLAEASAEYVAAGRAAEAQLINNLAVSLKESESWDQGTIENIIRSLAQRYEAEPDKQGQLQGITSFSEQLLNAVPQTPTPPPAAGEGAPTAPPVAAPAPADDGGGFPWRTVCLCLLGVAFVGAIVYYIGRRQFEKRSAPIKQQITWEGEGVPPIKQWTGTYTLGEDNYDEFFTIETEDGDFLGESGMGIMEVVPGTSPKQVLSFDVGLFDKTDITTLSRVVMSEHAYNDETTRAKVDANPQAEAVLAEPGKEFLFETGAMRILAKIDEVEYGAGGNVYFEKLTLSMDLFLKEGVDLKKGEMDVPEEFQ